MLSDEQLQEAWRRGVIREADRLGLNDNDVDRDLPVLRMAGWREIEAAVRADQIERDAAIAANFRKGYSQHPDDKPWEAAKAKIATAIRAQQKQNGDSK